MTRLIRPLSADRERPALHDARGTTRAGEAVDLIHRLARALVELGHGPGRVAALLGSASTRTYLASHALELIGGGQVELPVALPAEQQRALIGECGVEPVLADPEAVPDHVLRAISGIPGVRLWTLGPADVGSDLTAVGASSAPLASGARIGDPSRLTLTGGTTGRSKVVLRRFPRPGEGRAAWLVRMAGESPEPMIVLKTGRLTGLGRSMADAALATGGRFVCAPGFDPEQVCASIAEHRVTHLVLAPHELELLVGHSATAGADLSSLRFVLSATAATPPALLRRASEVLGPIVHPTYGQTESGLISLLSPGDQVEGDDAALRSCGRPLEGVKVQVRDADLRPVATGRRGRVWASTPNRMDEYWGRPEATARTLVDGWVDTGDTGFLDERGMLTILGRASEAMRVRGVEVHASEIDLVLRDHPAVRSCVSFDAPGPDGPGLHTAVVPESDEPVSERELLDWMAERPGPTPDSVLFVERLPLTYANEPCRQTLRSWLAGRPTPVGR